MFFSFFKPKPFEPRFPIIPLYARQDEVEPILESYSPVVLEDPPGKENKIAQQILRSETPETSISAGIFEGRVRYVNYLTQQHNKGDKERAVKLAWFVSYYGGNSEFDEPQDTGHIVFWRNPSKHIVIAYGVALGPIRVIDQDPSHWAR